MIIATDTGLGGTFMRIKMRNVVAVFLMTAIMLGMCVEPVWAQENGEEFDFTIKTY